MSVEMEWQKLYEASGRFNRVAIARLEKELEFKHEAWAVFRVALAGLFGHMTRMRELTAVRQARLQQRLVELGPAIVNMFFKREVFPLSAIDTALVEATVAGLSEADRHTFLDLMRRSSISVVLIAVWMDRYEKFKKEERERQLEEDRLVSEASGRHPEGSATGEMPNESN